MPEPTTKPKSPRTIDPDIAVLRQQHAKNVLDLKRRRTSQNILRTILEKRLPAMTDEDVEKLLAAIGPKPVTAPLPLRPAPAPQAPRQGQMMPGAVPVMGGRKP
jgi:Flp pilus assembly CpaE family ATPase